MAVHCVRRGPRDYSALVTLLRSAKSEFSKSNNVLDRIIRNTIENVSRFSLSSGLGALLIALSSLQNGLALVVAIVRPLV